MLEEGTAGTPATSPWRITYRNVTRIVVNGTVIFPVNSAYMFSGHTLDTRLTSLETIENAEKIDVSNVTNFGYMFHSASALRSVNVSNWDTSNGTIMNYMFNGNSSLTELNVSNWDTSNVTGMFFMFQNVNQLTELDVSNWETGNVTNINNMFNGVRRVTKLDVSNWDTSKVEGMQGVFQNTASLTEIDVSNWDTSKVKRTDYMFYNNLTGDWVSKLTTIDVSNWDTSNIENMMSMFGGARNLLHLDVSNWDTSSVTSMFNLFEVTPKIEELDLSNWDTTNVGSSSSAFAVASGMFRGMNGLKRLHLGDKTTFLHLAENLRPTLPENVMPAELYTGNWIFEKDLEGNLSTEHLTLTPTNFFHEYDGSKTGTYVWEKKEAQPVTVRYEDVDGNPLSTETILNGTIGLPYETEAKEIPGWFLTETPSNAFGTFTAEPQEVIYVYDRSDAASVTVKYEDTEGKQLSEPTILSGKVGLPYESEPKEIPGWYVPETPSNAHGIFGEEAQEVIYVYARSDAAPVTVKYEDAEGNQLSEPTILSGKVGLPYESEPKEIPGWYVPETPSNAHGIFGKAPQEVIYVYDRSDAAPVTVKYEDAEGNQLSEPTILSGKVGLPYESEPKEIPGWYVPETPSNAHGIFGEDPQEVIYVYDRSDAAPVTVKYEDTEGNQLSEPTILSGKVGLPYESEPKEIPGWYVPETPSNAHGIFGEDPQEVIYVYARSDSAPVTVKYEDAEGNQLSEPTILSGKVGLPYESEPKEIPGWYVPEAPSNAHGIFGEDPQEVIYVYDRSDAAPVTVKYEDTEGNQLSTPTILSGKVGLPYESEPKEIPGWYVPEAPSNAHGIFGEDPQEVIYVYDRSDAAPVTVKYEDTEGKQLSEPTILSGKVGLPYESKPKEIPGWYVPETPSNAQGIFSEDPQEVIYVYDRSDAAPVTVKYEDTEGNQLSESTILSGKVGLPYESEPKEIPGWYVPETPSNAQGIFSEDPQKVIYVYDRSDAAPVTVKYEDTEGNQLSEPTILSGKVGLPYESEPKEIPGWYVPETPSNAQGIFSEDPQEVIYVYDRSDAAPVTVKYEDTEGNQLSEPTILSGKVGLPYESEPKEIPGWYVPETPTNAQGIFSEDAQEVIYVYDRSHAAPVTVKYEDTEGNQLSEPTILSGKVGLPYESEPKEIPGWYVPEAPSNAHGIFGEDPQEVIYLYDRSDAAPVIVKYEDTEGNQLSKPTILTGKVDMPYESKPKEISGWTVMEIPTNASGTFTNDVQKVIYVYQKEGNNGGQTSPEKENPENDKRDPADPKLPHTGEMMAGQRIMLIVGSLLLLITLIIIFDKKKNKDR
ncbi:BspA family leucine-rich repeat surface protein [Enterococcus sp. PF-2]|uniref:MucBP domain-containing protein n=1 Tax=unclassified Enterococcus TaxID=2608891 RepID=UPI00111DD79D|nr:MULTISPECIES: MucBP domain-containing protein [unclassified Enterococcus]TPE06858.1 BspA family leucine-rich repeat surface protein [Enterococcus sp. PF-3]TPE27864.1 BspA family leucine-rich repeat surface protein [Enterococcus sp. PF-2]